MRRSQTIVIAGKTDFQLQNVKDSLSQKFELKDLGSLRYFLGMSITQDSDSESIVINQPAYTKKLLENFGIQECKPVATPVSSSSKLIKATESDECVDKTKYQSAVGSLMYLAVCTRPDISFAVNSLAKFNSKPTKDHWSALKHVLRYLQGTKNVGICYSKDSGDIIGYTDADWAGDLDDRKSTSGYLFMLCDGAVSWKSQKQRCVALSTAEAEYVAMSAAVQESVWLHQLISELTDSSLGINPVLIYEDNQAAIAMAKNPQFHGRAKHIEIKHHFICDQIARGIIKLEYCPTSQMIADILTKGLSRDSFSELRKNSGVIEQCHVT